MKEIFQNHIISDYSFEQLQGSVVVRHIEDAKAFFNADTLDIVLSVNEVGNGNSTSELNKMLTRLPMNEGVYPFSFPLHDYTVSGFLREETQLFYQAFTDIHILSSLESLLASFVTELRERDLTTGTYRTSIGLRIAFVNPSEEESALPTAEGIRGTSSMGFRLPIADTDVILLTRFGQSIFD